MNSACIIGRIELGPLGTHVVTYRWEGDPMAPVWIDDHHIDVASLPWPLAPLGEYDYSMRAQRYVRMDVRNGRIQVRLLRARYTVTRAWRWFTVRAVLTLHVWGFADYQAGREPSWHDVRRPKRGTL